MKYTKEGDSVLGKRLFFQGRKVNPLPLYQKSGSHRGQRAILYDGECWIEESIELPKKKKIKN